MPHDEPTAPAPRLGPARAPRDTEGLAVDIALRLAFLAVFVYLVLNLVRPFAPLALWSIVIAAALRPAFLRLAARLGGRRGIASAIVTLGALAVTLGPIAMLAVSLVESVEWLARRARSGGLALPDAPQALVDLPVAGPAIAANWQLAATNLEAFLARYGHLLIGAGERAAVPALHFAEGMATIVAAVALSGFLHPPGDRFGDALRRATRRVAGERGAAFVDIAAATIRNVARGVIGVAVIHALLVGVGLILGGVPAAGILTLGVLVLVILQIGAWPLVAGVLVWIWTERGGGGDLALSLYLVAVAFVDLPLKPLMLGRALATPALVIFAGVIGGVLGYGLLGLFLGPILLAIAYDLVRFALYGDGGRGGIA